MNTQTDNPGGGTQMHSLSNHHQQQHSAGGTNSNSSGGGSTSNSSNINTNKTTNSVLTAGQRESGMNSSNAMNVNTSSVSAGPSIIAHNQASVSESASSSMNIDVATSQSPLKLQQFTHHPPLHHHHHHHHQQIHQHQHQHQLPHQRRSSRINSHIHNSTTTTLRQTSTSPPASPMMNSDAGSSGGDTIALESASCSVTSTYTESLSRKHKEREDPLEEASISLSYPHYFTTDTSTQSVARQVHSPSLLAGALLPQEMLSPQTNLAESSSFSDLFTSNCDARDPRSSAACFTLASPSSSDLTAMSTPPTSLAATVSTSSASYRPAMNDNGLCTASSRTEVQHGKAKAQQHNANDTADGICGMLTPAPVGNLNPYSSYCISSVSPSCSKNLDGTDKKESQQKAASMTQSQSTSNALQPRRFVSPNVLLHRRLLAKTQSRTTKKSRLSPDKIALEQSFAAVPLDNSQAFQEQRRSSLGDGLSSTTSTSVPSDVTQSSVSSGDGFQLQPVPASKRKKVGGVNVGKDKEIAADVISPPVEKRRKKDLGSRAHFASSQQYRGMLTSALKPVEPMSGFLQTQDPCLADQEKLATSRQLEKKPYIHVVTLNTPSQPRSRVSRPRLSRTQSLPNLKAKPGLDLSVPTVHRLALPPRLVEYLSSLRENAQRQHHHLLQSMQDAPPSQRDNRLTGSAMAAQASSFARNGYCSTTIDSLGNVKSIFVPSLHPPITRQTLKELDLHEILKNPQLRHDIVFDSNVQFRPNFDGERGRKKKEFGNKYWFAIQKEIETGCTCTSFSGKMLLPCACGMDNGKTAISRFTNSLSSIKSPMPSLANYAHSGSGYNSLFASRNDKAIPCTPALPSANTKSPRSAIGLGGGRIPSRIPLLIQELRAICLSVLPSPPPSNSVSGVEGGSTPSSVKLNSSISSVGKPQRPTGLSMASPSSARSMASTPGTASSAVATHHILIAQALDPHLITQQLQHGILDIASLMSFLGSILKLHCAPMRDDVIEKMIKTVCVQGEVAMGLRMCFEILELMKLDIANHQLRSSRMYLIETAVDFEIRWFREQLDQRKMSLERTRHWFVNSISHQMKMASSTTLTRTRIISKSFDEGLMQLIMDPPLDLASSSTALLLGPTNVASTSLKDAYTNNYPETFQFDAYRLMSFHGDITDIVIVYMLLLLFRQLSCSSTNLTQEPLPTTSNSSTTVSETASAIATRQLNSVKSEIWTLLNDADQEISNGSNVPSSVPRTPTTPGLAGRLLCQGALSGSHKLENPAWRKAMNDVVLQIAARAIEVQIQAREPRQYQSQSSASSCRPTPPPREETMKMLMCWTETNLRRESPLHKLCQQRLKTVLCAFLDEGQPKERLTKISRKLRDEDNTIYDKSGKRIRLQDGQVQVQNESCSEQTCDVSEDVLPTRSDVEAAIQKGGLEPFTAEIKLLSERIIKVRTFHLRVFRCFYEKIANELQEDA